jgi:hypothetical protein
MNRRQTFLLLPIALTGGAFPGPSSSQSSELKESDPEAVALDYVSDARRVDPKRQPKYLPGQTCANCGLFVPQSGAPLGGCQLFYGKDVAAIGWCNAWEAKPQS